jgi:signal transduction histidine kinase
LEAFAYTVSHDLRAPLRAIDGFAAMAQDELHAAEQANFEAYLGSIRKSIRRMSDLIDGLLNFSRLNRTPLQRAHIDLDQLVEEVWRELIGLNRNRQIQFSCDRLGKYEGDLTLMRQVFTNLLSNALKFTRNTQQANIHVGCEECEGQMVCFVRDNGVGFDLKYRDKLFGVFERLHSGADYEGTGVGLAIAQRILKRHGGDIWAESAPGGGATFYFSLEQSVDKEAVA